MPSAQLRRVATTGDADDGNGDGVRARLDTGIRGESLGWLNKTQTKVERTKEKEKKKTTHDDDVVVVMARPLCCASRREKHETYAGLDRPWLVT